MPIRACHRQGYIASVIELQGNVHGWLYPLSNPKHITARNVTNDGKRRDGSPREYFAQEWQRGRIPILGVPRET